MAPGIKALNPSEDLISDRFCDVFDPQLQYSTISEAKSHLLSIPIGQSEFFDKLKVSLVGFTQESLPNCPEIVLLFSQHFSISEKVIMNTAHDHILCKIDAQSLQTLWISLAKPKLLIYWP